MADESPHDMRRGQENGYLRNCWYQAAWAYELDAGPLARTLLDTPLLLFRDGEKVAALLDRCPHRFAPLSAGKVTDGIVECGYHGLAFDGSGQCVRNPHGPVTRSMCTQAFPVAQRHHVVWLWFGNPELADEDLIPDLSFIDLATDTARILMHMPTAANYQLLTDNIMDLSHADYLHPETLGGIITGAKARQSDRGNGIIAEWTNNGCQAPGVFQAKIPSPAKADYYIGVEWQAPAVMTLTNTIVPAGTQASAEDTSQSLHNMTPETSTSTHYFMCATRNDQAHDAEFTKVLKAVLERAFLFEDKPMVEAQQQRMGDAEFWSLRPILLQIDAAGVKVRRRLEALMAAEATAAPASVTTNRV